MQKSFTLPKKENKIADREDKEPFDLTLLNYSNNQFKKVFNYLNSIEKDVNDKVMRRILNYARTLLIKNKTAE